MKNLTDMQWAAAIVIAVLVIGALILVGVGLSQPTPQEQLINNLRSEGITITHEKEFIDVIDALCPTIDTSYIGLDVLKIYMTESEALDTLRVVRYSGYCN